MSSEALTALKRSRSKCFRARDVDGLRVVLSQAEALQTRSPEPGLDTLIAALEQNILVLGGEAERPGPPPVAMPAAPRPAPLPEPPQAVPAAGPRQPAPASKPVVFEYAGWGRRFAAWLIDALLVGFLLVVASIVIAVTTAVEAAGWLELVLWVGAFPAYVTLCHGGQKGKTVGKAAVGIVVRREETYGRIGYTRAFGRWFATFFLWVFVLPGILDGFSPLWNDRKQAWHDRAVGTVVVRV